MHHDAGHTRTSAKRAARQCAHTRRSILAVFATLGLAVACGAADAPDLDVATRGDAARQSTQGMDTWRYPGDSVMARWRRASPYRWVGYYLAAPCRVDSSWVGSRARLERIGWGVAVLYLGQQAWQHPGGHAGANAPRAGASGACRPALLTSARGRVDGRDAIRNARRDGFARGTVIFLDVERMDTIPHAMRDYYQAWARAILTDGRYRVGVYVHTRNADGVVTDLRTECRRARAAACPQVWVAAPRGFVRTARPSASGHAFADVWQGVLDTAETWGGMSLPIDVNVSRRASPSATPTLSPR